MKKRKKHSMIKRLISLMLVVLMLPLAAYSALAAPADEEGYANLALGKVAASANSKYEGGYYDMRLLTDGVWESMPTLGWNSDTVALDQAVDITLNLEDTYSVDKMVLKPAQWSKGEFFPKDFELQLSADGETWTTVQTVTDADVTAESDTAVVPQEYTFEEMEAQYARIHITKHTYSEQLASAWSEIGEWEVWGAPVPSYTKDNLSAVVDNAKNMDISVYTEESVSVLKDAIAAAEELLAAENPSEDDLLAAEAAITEAIGALAEKPPVEENAVNLALGKAATSANNKQEGSYYDIRLLTDGKWESMPTLGWNSNNVTEDQVVDITLNLNAECTVKKMVLKPAQWSKGDFFPKNFELQLSLDGETWTTVQNVSDADVSADSDTAVVPQEYTFEETKAQYARIHITKHNYSETLNAYWSEIGEWEVWGVAKPYTKADLSAVVDNAKNMDTSAYTLESIGLLNNAIANAEALLASESPAEDDMREARDAINEAIEALAEKPESQNFAVNQKVEATNNYTAPEGFYDISFINDGEWLGLEGANVKLGWHTNTNVALGENDPVDITFKLDSSYALEKIVLKPMKWSWGRAFPQDFELLGSTDGVNWFEVYEAQKDVSAEVEDNGNCAVDSLAVEPLEYVLDDSVRIKYFRIHITRNSAEKDQGTGVNLSAIGEVELYGYEDGFEIKETTINKPALRMNPGECDWLELVVDKHLPTPEVAYKSSDESVATVDADGTVHAVAVGEAVITTSDVTNNVDYETTVLVDTFKVEDQFQIVTFMPYFWAEEVNEDYFDDLQASGITNVELNFALDSNAITYENNLKAIELAYERGMDVTVSEADFTNVTWLSKTDEEIIEFVKKYSHIPGVTGYYIEDESGTSWLYARQMALIKEIMPYAVTHVNYCGAYADNVRALYNELAKYGEGLLDYVMYDVYVFRAETCNEDALYTWLEYNRQIGQELNTPTANYIQSMDWNGGYRPNGDDIRYQVWAGLAYGIKQYSYFCYHTPRANAAETYGPAIVDLEGNPTDLFEPVSELNWQVRAIGDTLMKLDTEVVYHTGASFGGSYNVLPAGYYLQPVDREQNLTISRMVEKETGNEYGILVNRDYNNAQTVQFTLDEDVASISYISTETGETVLMTADENGVYTVELLAGEGVLLKLDEDYEFVLKEITDYYYLNKAIETAEALDLEKYKPEGKEEFQKALADAKAVAANEQAKQAEVDAARSALQTAMAELRMYAVAGANLALKKPVEATSSYEEGTYFAKQFLTDGVHVPLNENPNAGWSVNPYDVLGQESAVDITVDLEDEYLIDSVVLRPAIYDNGEMFPADYTVEVSVDKENWTKVGEGSGVKLDAALDQAYAVDSVKGRYVRIHITRHSDTKDGTGGYLSQIGELEVYGKDVPVVDEEEELAKADAAKVNQQIEALGTITLESEDAVEAARAAYDALSDKAKQYVTKLDVLEAAEEKLEELKDADEEKAAAKAAAAEVDAQIEALGTITLDSEDAVEAARAAYNVLSDEAKQYVTKLDVLEAAEEKLEELKNAKIDQEVYDKAKAELEAYRAGKDDKDYRDAQVAELDAALKAGQEAIDKADTAEEINAIVDAVKKAMDAVKTDAQLTAEEAKDNNTDKENTDIKDNADKDNTGKDDTNKDNKDKGTTTPATGDNSNVAGYLVLFCATVLGFTALVLTRKRRIGR